MRTSRLKGARFGLRRVLPAVLVTATLALYAPVVRFDFVHDDDPDYVVLNPRVAQGLTWENVVWAATAFEVGNWHPLTLVSHMADVSMFGMRPGAHHAVNVLLHAASVFLLFTLLRRVTGRPVRSALAAAFFAVHPLNVETVAWISQRKTLLCMVFLLVALRAHVAWARRGGAWRYAVSLVAVAAALASKPIAIVAPVLFLLLDLWPLGRQPAAGTGKGRFAALLLAEKIPYALLAGAVAVVTIAAQRAGGVLVDSGVPFAERLARASVAFAWYPARAIWPSNLSLYYPADLGPREPLHVVVSILVAVTCTVGAVVALRRHPWFAWGWAWYVVAILPVLGLVACGTPIVADRYAYLALVGPFTSVAFLGFELARRMRRDGAVALGLAALVALGALSAVTRATLVPWRDSVSLLERGVQRVPGDARLLAELGSLLEGRDRGAEAEARYREALALDPDLDEARAALERLRERRDVVPEIIAP